VFILFKVAGNGVKATNDTALAAAPADAATRVVLREGGLVEGQVVKQINTLVSSRPTLAEGRWRYDGTTVGVRVVLPGKVQALYTVKSVADQADVFSLWAKTTELNVQNGTAKKLGLPGYSPDGVAYTTQLNRVPRSITAANDTVLLRATDEGTAVLATKGSAAPGSNGQALVGANFAKFSDPVSGNDERTAFAATLSGGGVTSASKSGLWYFDGIAPLHLLARTGDPVEGGGVWGAFESLVLPDGENSGPLFTATLARNSSLGITAENNRGLWAVDSQGVLRQLVRTGQPLTVSGTSRVVKSFTALTPLPGVPGVASGYNDQQQVGVIATFTDGSTTLVNIVIP
jgi:hypothetical protein